MKQKVAVAQYKVPLSIENSISKLSEIADRASKDGVQLLVAPETSIGMLADVKSVGKDYLSDLRMICRSCEIAIATSFYSEDKGKYVNQGYIVSPEGEVLHSHKKIYLAPPEKDNDGIQSGKTLGVSDTTLGKLGMLICKDGFNKYSHFLYEKFGEENVEVVCIPTWSIVWDEMDTSEYVKGLFVYGAFSSRSFVLVTGNLNKGSFGRSLIISPIKGVLQEGSQDKEELLIEEIDLDEVKKAREFDEWWQPRKNILN